MMMNAILPWRASLKGDHLGRVMVELKLRSRLALVILADDAGAVVDFTPRLLNAADPSGVIHGMLVV
jgi:hypothetical protein